ncbi:MAG: amidohydrolase family protein [Dehalococcoidales bacterium]|nr:amidohydrolase family protein [Dehalococcoidales bacterium]
MIIDAHTHIFPPEFIARRQELLADPCFCELYSNPKARMTTAEELVASMDDAGIDVSVAAAIGWSDPELCMAHNDYLIESAGMYKGRIIGLGMVALGSKIDLVPELERIHKKGLAGIGELRPDIAGVNLADEGTLAAIMEFLAARSLVLLMHASEPTGHLYAGKGSLTPEKIYPFIKKYGKVKILLGHMGGGLPFYTLQPEVMRDLKNTFYDSAALPYLYESRAYRLSADLAGVEKILFGSDFPLMSQKKALGYLDSAGLPPDEKKLVSGLNAKRLFGIQKRVE